MSCCVPAGPEAVGRNDRARPMPVSDPPPTGRPEGNRFHRSPEPSLSGAAANCSLLRVEYRTYNSAHFNPTLRCAYAIYRCVITINFGDLAGIVYHMQVNLGCGS